MYADRGWFSKSDIAFRVVGTVSFSFSNVLFCALETGDEVGHIYLVWQLVCASWQSCFMFIIT